MNVNKFFVSVVAAFSVAGCLGGGQESDAENVFIPAEKLGSIGVGLMVDGKEVSTESMIWYHMDGAFEHDDVRSILEQHQPTGEGRQWWIDGDARAWVACPVVPSPLASDMWCQLVVSERCFVENCAYELRVYAGDRVGMLDEATNWDAAPESWYRGVFRWEDEFVSASEYASAYRAYRGDNYPGGPALEISVNGGKVTTRGWVRRAKEDFGIIVEDGRKVDK